MQATRGASAVSRTFRLVIATSAVVVALDQGTKVLAVKTLSPDRSVKVIDGVLHWTLQRNPGAAFGIFQRIPVAFTILAFVISIVVVRAARKPRDLPTTIALGLILGGALGNLADRMLRPPGVFQGHVIDFIDFRVWPTFNVADMAIVSGALLLALVSMRDGKRDATTQVSDVTTSE